MVGEGDAQPRTKVCDECGHRNHEEARFCDGCGAGLPAVAGAGAVGGRTTGPDDRSAGGVEPVPPYVDPGPPASAVREPPGWYRRPGVVLALAVGIVLLAGAAWAMVAFRDDGTETTASTASSTTVTTAATGAAGAPAGGTPAPTTAAPAPAPTTAPAPAPLTAPTITGLTPSCDLDSAPMPDYPCSITVAWDHPGGADSFYIVADSPSWSDELDNDFADGVGGTARSTRLTGLATDIEVCVTVSAQRGEGAARQDAQSAQQCTNTGSG